MAVTYSYNYTNSNVGAVTVGVISDIINKLKSDISSINNGIENNTYLNEWNYFKYLGSNYSVIGLNFDVLFYVSYNGPSHIMFKFSNNVGISVIMLPYYVGCYSIVQNAISAIYGAPLKGWVEPNKVYKLFSSKLSSPKTVVTITEPDINSLPINVAIKTLAYVEKKIFEYNRKVSVSVQEKQLTNGDVARWVVAFAGAIGEGFQSATSSSVGAAFVKEMKEFIQLFKFSSGLVNQTKSVCVIDIVKLEESARTNLNVTFSDVKAWFNVVGLPAVYKTALGCKTILGKLAMPMATFMAIAPRLEGDHEEYIYLTADNQVSPTETEKRIVIKGKLSTSDYWDLYSQAMLEEYGNDITGGTYSPTANDVSTSAEAYAEQVRQQAQDTYYNAMSEYYTNLNNGETTVTGTVTLTVPETAKVGLNILEGQAISLDASSVDGLSIPLDVAGVESMTPIPIEPIQWDGNSPPPWIANPIELHLSDMLTNWQPTVQIENPTEGVTVNVTGNVTATGTVTASGSVTASGNVTASGSVDVNGSAITLTAPTSIPLEGPTSIPLTAPTEPLNLTFDTTSAEAIKAISDNIAARTELETTRAEADTVLRDLQITNEQTTKDNTVKTTEKLYADLAVATSEAAIRGAMYGTGANQLEYVLAQVQAYNNLHDSAVKDWTDVQGNVLSLPLGAVGMMAGALPNILNEVWTRVMGKNLADIDNAEQLKDRIENIAMEFLGLYVPESSEIDEEDSDLSENDKFTIDEMNEILGKNSYREYEEGVE